MELSLLSKYRTLLMGIATLGIIISHSMGFGCFCPNPLLKSIIMHGSLGVDIFLFLSGLGCWYSLNGGGILNVSKWLKKRFIRIFIPYAICYFILEFIKNIMYNEYDILNDLLYFSTLTYWTDHKGFWFIALLVPLYIITPFVYRLLEKFKNRIIIGMIIILLLLYLSTFQDKNYQELMDAVIYNTIYAFKRATNFILGMMVAPYVKQNKRINVWVTIAIFSSLFLLQVVLRQMLNIYLFCNWCLTPILLIVFCKLLSKLDHKGKLYCTLMWFGSASLESYITNGCTQGIARWFALQNPNNDIFYGHYTEYSIVIVLGIVTAYIFHGWSQKIKTEIQI